MLGSHGYEPQDGPKKSRDYRGYKGVILGIL